MTTFVALASAIIYLYKDAILPLIFKQDATVTPAQIIPTLDSWKNYHSFTIHNSSAATVYAIWVQISADEHRLTNERINVDADIKSSDGRSFVIPKEVTSPPDVVLMIGRDSKGMPALFLVIRFLAPDASLSFNMTFKSRSIVDESRIQLKYLLSIVSTSRRPDRFKSKDKHFNMYFDKMPKGLTINARDKYYFMILEEKGEKQEGASGRS